MKTAEEPSPSLGETLEWLRKELSEMQIQDQRLLLTLRHLHSVLEELRADSAHWEDTRQQFLHEAPDFSRIPVPDSLGPFQELRDISFRCQSLFP
ncbi:uncharacterized protein C20orf202 homolog isoform X1 [Macaca mulatta]